MKVRLKFMLGKFNKTIIFTLISLNLGCSSLVPHWFPHNIVLDPQLNLSESTAGSKIPITLNVVDERLENILGRQFTEKNHNFNGDGLPIFTEQNVKKVIAKSIMDGLKHKGIETSSTNKEGQKVFRVELRHIKSFVLDQPFGKGHIHTQAAIKTYCMDGKKNVVYENFFRVENVEALLAPPSPEENKKFINSTISEVLVDIFNDQKLLNCFVN